MNPAELGASARLLAGRLCQLPAVAPRALLDAVSFEDTESALSRLLGGYLPGAVAWHSVADRPAGASRVEPARFGDSRPVGFGSPHWDPAGRAVPPDEPRPVLPGDPRSLPSGDRRADPPDRSWPAPSDEPSGGTPADAPAVVTSAPTGSSYAQWTEREVSPQMTRLTRGSAAITNILRAGAAQPDGAEVPTEEPVGHNGSAPQPPPAVAPARGAVPHADESGVRTVLPEPPGAPDDSWPDPEHEPLVDVLLERLRDRVELEFHRTYGIEGW